MVFFLAESSFSEFAHNICISSKKSAQKCASIHLPCPDGRVAANQQKRERKGGRDKKSGAGENIAPPSREKRPKMPVQQDRKSKCAAELRGFE